MTVPLGTSLGLDNVKGVSNLRDRAYVQFLRASCQEYSRSVCDDGLERKLPGEEQKRVKGSIGLQSDVKRCCVRFSNQHGGWQSSFMEEVGH